VNGPAAFDIAGRPVGGNARCLVIAEAGVNHNGDPALAHRLVDAAADAHADVIKFQTFDPASLASERAPKAAYQALRTGSDESQVEMLRRLVLSPEAHQALKSHAEERGLLFLSTPFDVASADFLERLGVAAFKVASGELTNHPFLAHLAAKGRPLLVSTGMSDLDEVEAAIGAIRKTRDCPLVLFHCTSSYPALAESVNLRAMDTLRGRFQVEVGYSDHSLGPIVAIAAVARGAKIVEKHLTLDVSLPGPDHQASMEPGDFGRLVQAIRDVESALGDGRKVPHPSELDTRRVARKSLFVARALAAGARLSDGDLEARRPGDGIPPSRLAQLIGRRVKRALRVGEPLAEEDLE
jgi:N-acetylneuraminate synthase/N,N'-diacetyllegionaminate synthase